MDLTNIDRILFYGCSFTSGMELADHIYLGKSLEEVNLLKKKLDSRTFYNRYNLDPWSPQSDLYQASANLSWGRCLADHFNLPFVSRAQAGSSNKQMLFKIQVHLENNLITENDLIIVGLTAPERIFTVNDDGSISSKQLSNADSVLDFYIQHFGNDYNLYYDVYNVMSYLDLLSHKLKGRVFQQFTHVRLIDMLKKINPEAELYSLMKNVFNFYSLLDPEYSFLDVVDWSTGQGVIGYGHPSAESHKMFSQHLKSKFLLK